jgi:hypothetical protein
MCRQDMPYRDKVQVLQEAQRISTNPLVSKVISAALRRIRSNKKKAKYPIFYKIDALIKTAFGNPASADVDTLTLRLRLSTMMRSVDMGHVVWGLFQQDGSFFLKTTDKGGKPTTFSITGLTLRAVRTYILEFKVRPAPFLLRYTNDGRFCMGAERIAKRLLAIMAQHGIDTEVFKAHSLRGATATHLMRVGVPRHEVRARGGWSSSQTLDTYYLRLHQEANWERRLQGEIAQAGLVCRSAAQTTVPEPEPTTEGEGEGTEESAAQDTQLSALGLLRPLYDKRVCHECKGTMHHEATYRCATCARIVHVRCLHAAGANRHGQTAWGTTCSGCSISL